MINGTGLDLFKYLRILYSTDKLIISDPAEFHGRSFLSHLYQLPWSEPLFTRRVEQATLMGKHMTFCRVSNETLSLVSIRLRFNPMSSLIVFSLYFNDSLHTVG